MGEVKINTRYWCFVPMCNSTGRSTPEKKFISVPRNLKTRRLWWRAARRALPVNTGSSYCCEDHFNLPEDLQNYRYMVTMGGAAKLKPGVIPHIFDCQGRGVGTNNNQIALKRKRKIMEIHNNKENISTDTSPAVMAADQESEEGNLSHAPDPAANHISIQNSSVAISTKRGVKRPKVVEEPEDSDSDDDQSEQDLEVEIKEEEEEEDYQGSLDFVGGSFMTVPNDADLEEVNIKEEEVDECEQGDSADKTKSKEKKMIKVKFVTRESGSSDSDFWEPGSEAEEDSFGDDDSDEEEEEGGEGKKKAGSGLANIMPKILGTKKSNDVILSKAKTDREVKKSVKHGREETFKVMVSSGQLNESMVEKRTEEKEEDRKPNISLHNRELHQKLWDEKFQKRLNITEDKDKDQQLRVLATHIEPEEGRAGSETCTIILDPSPLDLHPSQLNNSFEKEKQRLELAVLQAKADCFLAQKRLYNVEAEYKALLLKELKGQSI